MPTPFERGRAGTAVTPLARILDGIGAQMDEEKRRQEAIRQNQALALVERLGPEALAADRTPLEVIYGGKEAQDAFARAQRDARAAPPPPVQPAAPAPALPQTERPLDPPAPRASATVAIDPATGALVTFDENTVTSTRALARLRDNPGQPTLIDDRLVRMRHDGTLEIIPERGSQPALPPPPSLAPLEAPRATSVARSAQAPNAGLSPRRAGTGPGAPAAGSIPVPRAANRVRTAQLMPLQTDVLENRGSGLLELLLMGILAMTAGRGEKPPRTGGETNDDRGAPDPVPPELPPIEGAPAQRRKRSIPQTSTEGEFKAVFRDVWTNEKDAIGEVVRGDLGPVTVNIGQFGKYVVREKNGQLVADIEGGYGLRKIVQKRTLIDNIDGENFALNVLPEVLAKGRLVRLVGKPHERRAIIELGENRAILSLFRFEKRETWLLTGFVKN